MANENNRISIEPTYATIGHGGGKTSGGGKGGSANTINEKDNTIRTKSYIKLLFLLGEGKIRKFIDDDPLKSIYLNETPIRNSDGSLNFKDIVVDVRLGTQDQSYIPGVANALESEENVGVQVKFVNGGVTRTINDSTLDRLKLRFLIPALRNVDDKGNIVGASIQYRVLLQSAGTGFNEVLNKVISEKSNSSFEVQEEIALTGVAPWTVRVERITPDSTSEKLSNNFFWQGYTEITDVKLRYPNSALLFIQTDAEQFSSIPKVSVGLELLEVLVPHNYDPFTRKYTGFFNGSMIPVWTDNPAWIIYDLLTNNRYGLGDRIDETLLNINSFYALAQYCDELVPDGFGGFEPRFTCNAYIQNQDDAIKLLDAFASVCRSQIYSTGGSLFVTQDRPLEPTKDYSPVNVIEELDEQGRVKTPCFSYSYSGLDTRFTACSVSWSDPKDFYRTKTAYYEDNVATSKYGLLQTDVVGFGITSQGQAYRLAKWTVEVSQKIQQTVTFKVGSQGELVNIGEGFNVANPLKQVQRLYGRTIKNSTTTRIFWDSPLLLDEGVPYRVRITNPQTGLIEVRNAKPQISADFVEVTAPFSFEPPKDSVWLLETDALKPKPYRCINIAEDDTRFEIIGIEYNHSLFDSVDRNTKFTVDNYSGLNGALDKPLPVSNINVVETLYQGISSAGLKIRLDISWTPSPSLFVTEYQVGYKKLRDVSYQFVGTTKGTSFSISDVQPDIYDIVIYAKNGVGTYSDEASIRIEVFGLTKVPTNVTGAYLTPYENSAILQWDNSPDLDVRIGGYFKIKHTAKTSNVNWFDGIDVTQVNGVMNSATVPLLDGTYLIKAIDSENNQSTAPAIVLATNLPQLNKYKAETTLQESPSFSNTKVSTVVSNGFLKLATSDLFDSKQGLFDDFPGLFDDASNLSAVLSTGSYTFGESIDLGAAYTCRITPLISAVATDESNLFDSSLRLFDSRPGSFDGEGLDQASAQLLISRSVDGSNWIDYQPVFVGDYLFRKCKFKMQLASNNSVQNILIQTLSVKIDMPERTESNSLLSSTSSVTRVDFLEAFREPPQVTVIIQNASAGDRVSSVTMSEGYFDVAVMNGSSYVQRQINYIAQGYGRKLV